MHKDGLRPVISNEKLADKLHRLLRSGKANARRRFISQRFQPLERKREVRAALIVGNRVNFIHNDRLDRAKQLAASSRSQQNIKRLRRGYQNMRGPLLHRQAFARQSVSGSHRRANHRHQETLPLSQLENLAQRDVEVSLNVVAKGFER